MSNTNFRRALQALVVSVLCARAAAAQSPLENAHPVRAVFMQGIAEFNAHRLDPFLEQFAPELEMYAADAGWLRTTTAIRQRYVTTFARFPNVRMAIDSLRVREAGADAAVVNFVFRVYPNGTGPAFEGIGSGTYVRRADRWVEVQEHETVTHVDPLLKRPAEVKPN